MTKLSPIQWLGRRWINRNIKGPRDQQREKGRAEFWGRATDQNGRSTEATLTTPEGYSLTVQTATEIVRKAISGELKPGFWTPAKAFGAEFIEQFDRVHFEWKSQAHEP